MNERICGRREFYIMINERINWSVLIYGILVHNILIIYWIERIEMHNQCKGKFVILFSTKKVKRFACGILLKKEARKLKYIVQQSMRCQVYL